MNARKGHSVHARLTKEDFAALRSLGTETDAEAVRLLIQEHRAGESLARMVRSELEPWQTAFAQLDEKTDRNGRAILALRKELLALKKALTDPPREGEEGYEGGKR